MRRPGGLSLRPQAVVTAAERERGLRLLVLEAVFSGGVTALTTGVILTAFALQLGASNAMVGVLASAPFLTQLLQAPAIVLVERLRARKLLSVATSLIGRLMLGVMAAVALAKGAIALPTFLVAQFVLCGLGAVGSCAWTAWMRDLAPEERLGRVFARRTAWLTAVNLALGLAAALALQIGPAGSRTRDLAFAGMFAVGCITGLISAGVVSAMPEPAMAPSPGPVRLLALLREPFGDANFRRLLGFVASWQFAVNLATPFFTVFIVRQLHFDVSFVLVLGVVSQLANLLALRGWGALSDRFANKPVLAVCAPAYILAIVGMAGASQLQDRQAAVAWLVALHAVMGAAVAGVTLTSTNIALKLSPRGSATAYVAANAMATAVAAGLAPILGGLLADAFAARRLEVLVRWTGPRGAWSLPIGLTHWDFYFLLSGLLGVYALHRLSLVEETGAYPRRAMLDQVLSDTRRSIRNVSSIAGLRAMTHLPASLLQEARVRLRWDRARAARDRP